MKKTTLLKTFFLLAGLLILSTTAFSADLTLGAAPTTGYYYSDSTIYSATSSCIIQQDRQVQTVSQSVELKPGFTVQAGGYFGVTIGTYADIPEDLDFDSDNLPDYWEFANFNDYTSQDQWSDYDSDGINNGIEYELDSDPTDSSPAGRPDSGAYYKYDAVGRIIKTIRVK